MKKAVVIAILLFLIIVRISNSAAPSATFPREIKYFDRLTANDEQFMLINNPEILFTKVGVETNKEITRVRLTVQAMPDCPENAPYQTDVLQCFVVTPSGFRDNDISSAEIHFKVPKEWIAANRYKDLELRRYSYSWNVGGKLSQWRSLNTVLENEDDRYYHYKSTSDGFSYFSIVGSGVADAVPTQSSTITNNEITETPAREESPQIIPTETKSSSNPIWMFLVILAAISIVVSFVLHRKHINNEVTDDSIPELEPIIEYINSVQGYPEDQVRSTLEDFGWKDWQIEMAFNQVKLK